MAANISYRNNLYILYEMHNANDMTDRAVNEVRFTIIAQMETFSALLAICAGNSTVTGEFHVQRPVTWSFGVSFDLRPNKRLSKQSWGWCFETPSCSLWRHCNGLRIFTAWYVALSYVDHWHACVI